MAGTLSFALRLIGVGETGVAWAGSFTICERLLSPTRCFNCPCAGRKLVTSPSVQQSGLHKTWNVGAERRAQLRRRRFLLRAPQI